MADEPKTFQKTLLAGIAGLALSGIGWLIARSEFPQSIDKKTARILLLFVSICIVCWMWWRWRRNERKVFEVKLADVKVVPWQNGYVFDENAGIYRHGTKPGVFCSACFQNEKISPMMVIEHGWYCPGCKSKFKNPDNPPPKRERISIRPFKGWLD